MTGALRMTQKKKKYYSTNFPESVFERGKKGTVWECPNCHSQKVYQKTTHMVICHCGTFMNKLDIEKMFDVAGENKEKLKNAVVK